MLGCWCCGKPQMLDQVLQIMARLDMRSTDLAQPIHLLPGIRSLATALCAPAKEQVQKAATSAALQPKIHLEAPAAGCTTAFVARSSSGLCSMHLLTLLGVAS